MEASNSSGMLGWVCSDEGEEVEVEGGEVVREVLCRSLSEGRMG